MTDNNQPQEEKHESRADKAAKAEGRIFLNFWKGYIPLAIDAAIKNRGLSTKHPQVSGKFSELVNAAPIANEPDPWFDVHIQYSPIERPTRMTLDDLYQEAAENLASDMQEKYMEGTFGDARVVLDATVTMEITLDEANTKLVGAKNVTIKVTITDDVTESIPSSLEVEVVNDK